MVGSSDMLPVHHRLPLREHDSTWKVHREQWTVVEEERACNVCDQACLPRSSVLLRLVNVNGLRQRLVTPL